MKKTFKASRPDSDVNASEPEIDVPVEKPKWIIDVPVEKPKWIIEGDIDFDLKRQGLELLEKGMSTRKIANFCAINIKQIKRL